MLQKDWYRILKVEPTASLKDIKTAYRKLVLELHPDRHVQASEQQKQQKLKDFKLVTEAYDVLTDDSKRRQFDFDFGHSSFTSGRSPRSKASFHKDYRKVYTARPPPNWTKVWDHKVHYEMHYGTGMQQEALKSARKQARKEGLFDYQSPLGKGFTFERDQTDYNPFSKLTPQGPPKVKFDYEEGYQDGNKTHSFRRERVVEDMYQRRHERQQSYAQSQSQQQRRYQNPAFDSKNDCVIL